MPGCAESLIHWRSTVEEAAARGLMEPAVIADLVMENFFNSVEWPAIRSSIEKHFKDASNLVQWEQQSHGVTILPDGSELNFNRGAEQGESLVPIKAVLNLGDGRSRLVEAEPQLSHVCDEWYMDDGQVVCKPLFFSRWLERFDSELQRIGAAQRVGP